MSKQQGESLFYHPSLAVPQWSYTPTTTIKEATQSADTLQTRYECQWLMRQWIVAAAAVAGTALGGMYLDGKYAIRKDLRQIIMGKVIIKQYTEAGQFLPYLLQNFQASKSCE